MFKNQTEGQFQVLFVVLMLELATLACKRGSPTPVALVVTRPFPKWS